MLKPCLCFLNWCDGMKKQIVLIISIFLVIFCFIGCTEDTSEDNDTADGDSNSNNNDNNDDDGGGSDNANHEPVTLYVDDDGSVEYDNIIDAVANSLDGDTIYVYNGIYDGEITVDKSITIVGEDKTMAIVDGTLTGGAHLSGGDNGFIITANDVSISGFNIQNSENDVSGVAIKISGAENVTIFDNIINNTAEGVSIEVEKYGFSVSDSNDRSKYNMIRDNEITTNDEYCISIDKYSNYNTIKNNVITQGIGSIEIGSDGNIVFGNTMSLSSSHGIKILSRANDNIIYKNSIFNCDQKGLSVSGDNNYIYLNNIYDNSLDTNFEDNVYSSGDNTWYNESLMKGNYYGDFYTGTDSDGDGIGDSSYEIPGGEDMDLYPLTEMVNI